MSIVVNNRLTLHLLDIQAGTRRPERAQTDRNPVNSVSPRPDDRQGTDIRIQIRLKKGFARASGKTGEA